MATVMMKIMFQNATMMEVTVVRKILLAIGMIGAKNVNARTIKPTIEASLRGYLHKNSAEEQESTPSLHFAFIITQPR